MKRYRQYDVFPANGWLMTDFQWRKHRTDLDFHRWNRKDWKGYDGRHHSPRLSRMSRALLRTKG